MLDQTLELARDRIELKRIKLQKNYSEPDCTIDVDGEKMKIAFLNIIVNAIEAMDRDDPVLRINFWHDGDKCFVEIKDNGMGMDEETQQKLFDPYFTKKRNGSGLGLTHTQNIILNHQGSISVKSNMGEGSVFTVMLNVSGKSVAVVS